MHRELIAEVLVNQLPRTVWRRIGEIDDFLVQFGMSRNSTIMFDKLGPFDSALVFDALRGAFGGEGRQKIVQKHGDEFGIEFTNGKLQIDNVSGHQSRHLSHPVFYLLSTDPQKRAESFELLLSEMGPSAPDFSAIGCNLPERVATDTEMCALVLESEEGVAGASSSVKCNSVRVSMA